MSQVFELAKAAAARDNGGGDWVNSIDSGVTINPGDRLQVLKSYVHIPGSSQGSQAGNLVVSQDLTCSFRFEYYAQVAASYSNTPWATSGYDLWTLKSGVANTSPTELAYLGETPGAKGQGRRVRDEVTLTLNAGSYTPGRIAETLTEQLRLSGTGVPGINTSGGFFMGLPRGPGNMNSATFRTILADQHNPRIASAILQSADSDLTFTTTDQTGALYGLGCSTPTIVYNEATNRFQWSYLHTPMRDRNGDPAVFLAWFKRTGAVQWVGRQGGISIIDFAVDGVSLTRDTWPGSLFHLLGFEYDDLQGPALNGGIISENLPQPVWLTDFNSTLQIANDNVIAFPISGPAEDVTTGPVASSPPSVQASQSGYWRIEITGLPGSAGWRGGDGRQASQAASLADREFASGDVYVSSGLGNEFEYVGEPATLSELGVRIIDPGTGLPEPLASVKSAVILQLTRGAAA